MSVDPGSLFMESVSEQSRPMIIQPWRPDERIVRPSDVVLVTEASSSAGAGHLPAALKPLAFPRLEWSNSDWGRGETRSPPSGGALRGFLRLADSDATNVLDYAKRWGVLG